MATRAELRKMIDDENLDQRALLKEILIELRLFNSAVVSSQEVMQEHQKRAREEVDRIKEGLPPEARAIYDSLTNGFKGVI